MYVCVVCVCSHEYMGVRGCLWMLSSGTLSTSLETRSLILAGIHQSGLTDYQLTPEMDLSLSSQLWDHRFNAPCPAFHVCSGVQTQVLMLVRQEPSPRHCILCLYREKTVTIQLGKVSFKGGIAYNSKPLEGS